MNLLVSNLFILREEKKNGLIGMGTGRMRGELQRDERVKEM